MTKKERVTKGLKEVGAAWAVSSQRYICTDWQCCDPLGKRAYHVHPNASYPHQNDIKRFRNLGEIIEYIKAVKVAVAAESPETAFEIMSDFWESFN